MDGIFQKYEAALREIDRLKKENNQLRLRINFQVSDPEVVSIIEVP